MAANQTQVPNMTTINAFWSVYVGNMNIGRSSEITMPIGLKSVIGQAGIDIMVARFRNIIEAPVTATEDLEQGSIKIAPVRNPLGHASIIQGAQKAKPRTSTKAKVARPPNAFILYRQHHHPLVKSEYPELHNNQISVILGTQWKLESDAKKAQYTALASRLKARHLLENPGYQYQPRKPSEKKRRMTRRSSNKTVTTTPPLKTSGLSMMADQQELPELDAVNAFVNSEALRTATPAPLENPTTDGATPAVASTLAPTIEHFNANVEPDDDFTFSKTIGGNAFFDLGDKNMDEDHLAAMLMEYNDSLPTAPNDIAAISRPSATPVLYNEHTEEVQDDANFYSSMIDYDSLITSPMDLNDFFDFHAAALPSPTF